MKNLHMFSGWRHPANPRRSAAILKAMLIMLVGGMFFSASGCSSMKVAAWEKGNLANPVMVRDTSAQHAGLEQHTYTSKEATEGGYSLGAGGCGCN